MQSFLAPRKLACEQFNEKFGLTGTDKAIDVRVRSDLHNIVKNMQSTVSEFQDMKNEIIDKTKLETEVKNNGNIYN